MGLGLVFALVIAVALTLAEGTKKTLLTKRRVGGAAGLQETAATIFNE